MKGFPEDMVIKENEKMNQERTEILRTIHETEKRLEQAKESHIDLDKVEDFCKIASHNLADFGYAEKQLTLELEGIKQQLLISPNSLEIGSIYPTLLTVDKSQILFPFEFSCMFIHGANA